MRIDREDEGHQRIATFDIETTHYDPEKGEVVSIGVAVHERGAPLSDAGVRQFHRLPDRDEAAVITRAYEWLDAQDPDLLVSFNGRDFDVAFTDDRLELLGADSVRPVLDTDESHIDLFADDRKQAADEAGEKWPTLEEVVEQYTGEAPPALHWRGEELTNVRFGEELGPAYLAAVDAGDDVEMASLELVIDAYLRQDLLCNLLIYYHDIGAL